MIAFRVLQATTLVMLLVATGFANWGSTNSARAEPVTTQPPSSDAGAAPGTSGPASGAAQPTPTTADGKPDPNEVICKRLEMTGTRVSRQKVCMTRADWDEETRQDQSLASQARSTSNGVHGAGAGTQ